mgnify:FL=1
MKLSTRGQIFALSLLSASVISQFAVASSHREAPFIAGSPKVDGTDFYMFRSYEAGRGDFVTLIANYQPLQDAYGGPNYFTLDPTALYEIHVDNNGDAVEDITFQFQFNNAYGQANAAGLIRDGGIDTGAGSDVQVPLAAVAPASVVGGQTGLLNVVETYSVNVVRGDRRSGTRSALSEAGGSNTTFTKPVDNIGALTIPDYESYANQYIYEVAVPGCATPGRLFVGQRREGFVVNLGEIFDQVNLNPLGARDSRSNWCMDDGE